MCVCVCVRICSTSGSKQSKPLFSRDSGAWLLGCLMFWLTSRSPRKAVSPGPAHVRNSAKFSAKTGEVSDAYCAALGIFINYLWRLCDLCCFSINYFWHLRNLCCSPILEQLRSRDTSHCCHGIIIVAHVGLGDDLLAHAGQGCFWQMFARVDLTLSRCFGFFEGMDTMCLGAL